MRKEQKLPINSRQKGAAGEREWAAYLRDNFGLQAARRGRQYSGSPDSPDVVSWDGTHCEVKRVERLCLTKAMSQCVSDSGDKIPFIAHRRNFGEWMITVTASDLLEFSRIICRHSEEQANES